MRHLKARMKWNWWWNFASVYPTISLNFEIYFIEFQWVCVFGVISDNFFILSLYMLENSKRILLYLKFFWYKVFVH